MEDNREFLREIEDEIEERVLQRLAQERISKEEFDRELGAKWGIKGEGEGEGVKMDLSEILDRVEENGSLKAQEQDIHSRIDNALEILDAMFEEDKPISYSSYITLFEAIVEILPKEYQDPGIARPSHC